MTMTSRSSPAGSKRTIRRWWRVGLLVLALLLLPVAAVVPAGARVKSSAEQSRVAFAATSARSSAERFIACVRAHGVPNFPASAVLVSGGQVAVHVPGYIKREPRFLAASMACSRYLPGGGASAKHVDLEQEIQKQLSFAKCMRSHGISDFPDPLPGGGFDIPGNTNSPQFKAAEKACEAKFS